MPPSFRIRFLGSLCETRVPRAHASPRDAPREVTRRARLARVEGFACRVTLRDGSPETGGAHFLGSDQAGHDGNQKYRVPSPRTLEFVTRFRGAKGSGDLAAVRHNHPLRRPLPVTEPRFLARDRPCRFTAPFVTDDPVVRPPRKVSRLRENRHGCRRERLHSFMGPFQPPGPAPLGFLRARRGAAARSSR